MSRSANQLRIIGGQWRSRKFNFVNAEGLRPTPDRVRETLFNWLQFEISGTHCLDAFAGSGALGFEALSRGAASVVFIEKQHAQFMALQETKKTLNAAGAVILSGEAQALLSAKHNALIAQSFDGVFLDPPFHQDLLRDMCVSLHLQKLLKPHAFVYVESECEWAELNFPTYFVLQKNTRAGLVSAYLARYEPA